MRPLVTLCLGVWVTAGAANAHASDLMVRVSAGAGYAQTNSTELDVRIDGPVSHVDLLAGWRVTKNIFAVGLVFAQRMLSPTLTQDELEFDSTSTLVGAGVGAQFLLRDDWRAGAGFYLARQRLRGPDGRSADDFVDDLVGGTTGGFGGDDNPLGGVLSLEGGRDWWVSETFGLGFSVQALFGQIEGSSTRWYPASATLSVSATYR